MQDDSLTTPLPPAPPQRSWRTIAWVALLAFLVGGALFGWLVWRGGLDSVIGADGSAGISSAQLAGPVAAPPSTAASTDAVGTVEMRVALLEERLSRLDLQANAASGNAARAEGLLIAFAARRLIDKGEPLGFVEDQLKLRFADAQPHAVRTIIEAAKTPVTRDMLSAGLDARGPSLALKPDSEDVLTRVRRELSGLFVIRRETTPSTTPERRLVRAQLMLAAGRISGAIAEVERLPGANAAREWIAAAQRYDETQNALDLIETTAMLEPRRLHDSEGRNVDKPSPLAAPVKPGA